MIFNITVFHKSFTISHCNVIISYQFLHFYQYLLSASHGLTCLRCTMVVWISSLLTVKGLLRRLLLLHILYIRTPNFIKETRDQIWTTLLLRLGDVPKSWPIVANSKTMVLIFVSKFGRTGLYWTRHCQ